MKSEKILDILWAFFIKQSYSTWACWIWDEYGQLGLGATRFISYLPSHIQCALVE